MDKQPFRGFRQPTQSKFSTQGAAAALLLLLFLLAGCGQLDLAVGPTLYDVKVAPALISPNADGQQDVTEVFYSLRRTATVNIYFENEAGERFYFRQDQRRSPGDYRVQWGGVVDEPHTMETSYGPQEILSQVLAAGAYRWTIEAAAADAVEQATGTITLEESDTTLPELHNFTVVPTVFTPNQDSLDDRVSINYALTKDVDKILVYLQDPAQPDNRYILAEKPGLVKPEERGNHEFDYDGGVDLNAEPPPDGTYNIVGEARDRAGNAVRVVRQLTIKEGGKPRADVAGSEIHWQGEMSRNIVVPLGEKICFEAVVVNESTVPLRTSGPEPGQEYRFSENYNKLAATINDSWYQQAGVWRFGINFDTTGIDFPFRWAIGRPEDLEKRVVDGQEQWYLLPGKSGQVRGCIVMDEPPPISTNFWWGGLIHESVAVVNNNIDRISVQVGLLEQPK
jgi:hypothetical protein